MVKLFILDGQGQGVAHHCFLDNIMTDIRWD